MPKEVRPYNGLTGCTAFQPISGEEAFSRSSWSLLFEKSDVRRVCNTRRTSEPLAPLLKKRVLADGLGVIILSTDTPKTPIA